MKWLTITSVLLFAAYGNAQPVEGPWDVLTVENGWQLGQVRLISIAQDTVGIFYGEENTDGDVRARYATYSLTSQSLIGGPVTLFYASDWRATYDDAIPLGDRTWACTIYAETGSTYGGGENAAILVHGGPTNPMQSTFTLHEGVTEGIGGCWGDCSATVACHLWRQQGGGVLVAGSALLFFDIGGPAREIDAYLSLWSFGASYSEPDWTVMPQSPAWVGPSYHWPFSLSEDSAVVVSAGAWGNYLIHAGASSPEIVGVDTFQFGMTYMQYAMRTSGGQTLLWGQSAYYEVLSLSDSGVCERLAVWQPEHYYSALTSHPDYGFAVLFVEPSSLQLARMDTTAQHIQNPPIGTFYWRDGEHIIEEGNLTIADDGRVMIVWSERTEGSPDATRLRIGTVGWTTPLNVSENFISHPSSFILSAYPNPFNSETTIRFNLSHGQNVELSVYNVLGERIETLTSGQVEAGEHAVTWRANAASGIYFLQLTGAKLHVTQKIMLLR